MAGVVRGEVATDERATGAESPLGTSLLGHLLTAGESRLEIAAASQLGIARANGFRASLDEVSPLGGLFGVVVAWVSQHVWERDKTQGQELSERCHC